MQRLIIAMKKVRALNYTHTIYYVLKQLQMHYLQPWNACNLVCAIAVPYPLAPSRCRSPEIANSTILFIN